jgi:hypothetical protein
MSILSRLAYTQNRRDQAPNKELALELIATKDEKGIHEIAENLGNENPRIQSDCLSVFEEISAHRPEVIVNYVNDLLKLAHSNDNRLVWGSLIPLSRIAHLKADDIFPHREYLIQVMEEDSVITSDNAIKILAIVASRNIAYKLCLLPYLLKHLEICRAKDVPQHAEATLLAIDAESKDEFSGILEKRMADLSIAQAKRLKRVLRDAEER